MTEYPLDSLVLGWLEVRGIEYTYVDKLEEWMNES